MNIVALSAILFLLFEKRKRLKSQCLCAHLNVELR
ncbi:uncharacterized protein DC041_0006183 [Schistosoma bovis]|nr:uncharacterized protein DC041_0006183 [Schistosoma bovis]